MGCRVFSTHSIAPLHSALITFLSSNSTLHFPDSGNCIQLNTFEGIPYSAKYLMVSESQSLFFFFLKGIVHKKNSFVKSHILGYDRVWSRVETPTAVSPNPGGKHFRPNFASLGGFQSPPTKVSYTTPRHIPKYKILQKNFFCELSL